MENNLYPPAPAGVDPVDVSPAFRKQVGVVITSIVLFALVYLLLVAAAIVLAIVLCWLGVAIIIAKPMFLTLILGLGLICVGVSVIVFLVKFIFAVARDENSRRVEITEEQHPRLYAFIRRLTTETQTPFPKKIFLSPDVNACVFYNSSFWSMFFPVRKNLEIGLGLVNSINLSEFKAVVAHEFGHFSQKSMKLGSFTYNVNKVIHNMLFENNSYSSFLRAWGNLHGYLRIFVSITVKIAEGIQWILRGMYKQINKNYRGLSREMEFHADTVAASVSGGNNVISALSRIEVAANCYNSALNNANTRLKENRIATNIFTDQLVVLQSLAGDYHLPVKNGLPEISYHFIQSFSRSRINYRDQWASHPTLPERKAHLDRFSIDAPPDTSSPWLLFEQPQALQEQLTRHLYANVTLKDDVRPYDSQEFGRWYNARKETYALPPAYNGFYEGRFITVDWDLDAPGSPDSSSSLDAPGSAPATFEQLFNDETGQLQTAINSLEKDIELVKAIRDRRLDVTSFDVDGIKHSHRDADTVIKTLEKDTAGLTKRLQSLDRQAYYFFLQQTLDKDALRNAYRSYRSISREYDEYAGVVNMTLKTINPFYAGGISHDAVMSIIATLKEKYEPQLRQAYIQLMDRGLITPERNSELYASLKAFITKDYRYFVGDHFNDDELNELTGLAIRTAEYYGQQRFMVYKQMLELQLSSISTSAGPHP
ncbi:MAG TPA: M48 family metallopeptidase [Puia sp.]|nr:M48 family metallopeptidase [Puia sp.]